MRALVIGAGIGGLCAARALDRAGVETLVLERVPALEQVQVGGAIHVWHNGMRGLQKLGFGERVEELAGPAAAVDRTEMRNWRGKRITWWDVKETAEAVGAPTVGVLRSDLHRVLVEGIERDRLLLGRECVGFEQDGEVIARFADGSEERGDLLIGADGIRSAVRRQLAGDEKPRFAGYASWQAVADYRDEATPDGLFWIVWGPGARFLFYRVSAERVYWEGIFATPEGEGDPPGGRKQAVLDRYAGWTHPVEAIVAATEEHAISRADAYDRKPLKRWGEGGVTLLGDAAHAMTNAMGQGANQTIEDAVVLGATLAAGGDPAGRLRAYEDKRIGRTSQTAVLAWNLSRMARWRSRPACAARDGLLRTMFAVVGKRRYRKDMAHEL